MMNRSLLNTIEITLGELHNFRSLVKVLDYRTWPSGLECLFYLSYSSEIMGSIELDSFELMHQKIQLLFPKHIVYVLFM